MTVANWSLEGRVALVTGGSRGIGRGICMELARAGADVAVNYTNNKASADEVVAEIEKLGRKAAAFQADVSNWEQCQAMAHAALDEFGFIDILVNNGGIGAVSVGRPTIADAAPEDMLKLMTVHAMGSFHMSKLLVPQMRERPRGNVIMITSVAAQRYAPRSGTYAAAKAAQEAIAFTLAKEERENGVRVNIIAPGYVESDLARSQWRHMRSGQAETSGPTGEDLSEMAERQPFGFMCQPEDIGAGVVYLCSDAGRYITNERLTISGGLF
jgi:3-oxoacyl-[acyl-carrier protein] reductase